MAASQTSPLVQDIADIVLRLGDRWNAPAFHSSRPGIVCGECERYLAETVELRAQVTRPALEVLDRIETVDTQTRRRRAEVMAGSGSIKESTW